jgi:hypothetical protein
MGPGGEGRVQYSVLSQTLTKGKELASDIMARPETFGKLNFINTQLHKAIKHPAFRKIFERYHSAAGTQARAAARAAELAPNILPDYAGGFTQTVNELLHKGEFTADDLRAVSRVMSMGTLAGKTASPFAGHRLTEDELASLERGETIQLGGNDITMTAKQVKLYRQARAALDQMLNDTRQARSTAEQSGAAARQEAEAIGSRLREVTADKARLEAEAASARRERDLRIEALRGDLDAEQAEAGKVRAQRAALADELGALRRETERAAQRMDAENARLRAEISHVAEQFLKLRSGSALRLAPEHDGVGAARSLDAASAPQDHAQPRQKVAFSKPLSLPPVPDAAVE